MDRLYVANGKDGSVRVFDGNSYALLKTIDYGDDADNLRYDAEHKRIYVGYGGGALANSTATGTKSLILSLMLIRNHFSSKKTVPEFM